MSKKFRNNELVGHSDQELLTIEDLRALASSGRALAEEVGFETLLQRILETVGNLTESPETSIILRNDLRPTLYFAAATGDEAAWVLSNFGFHSEKQVPIEGSKAGKVYSTGISIVENIVKDHFLGVDKETQGVTKCMVCVPLHVGDERLGVMQVLNKRSGEYTRRDLVILEHIAAQASVAIRNARLLESLLAHSGLYGATRKTDELFARMREINQEARMETLSVLFADMRGFTQLCQSLVNPILVQERLSEFVSMLSDAVLNEDGIVNKFLGDGVMALFQGERCSERAIKCAFSMINNFSIMKKRWDAESNQQLEFLDMGVGVTTDQVILGGIGRSAVRDYTAIGTAVNLAAAFEASARNGKRVLCDQVTYQNALNLNPDVDAPQDFVLKKPGQEVGVRYKCYHVKTLNGDRKPRVFISHSHEDADFVSQLTTQLKDRGIQTWSFGPDIQKGALWTAEIRKAIAGCNWMAVIVSKSSANSKWIRREVDLALTAQHLEDRIIPVAIDDTDLRSVNEYLPTMQAISLSETGEIVQALHDAFTRD